MREPAFWWRKNGLWPRLAAGLLAPIEKAYGTIAEQRMAPSGARAPLPVLCVGNFTLGGAGKTPTAIMFARILREAGETPFCLTRGYGGTVEGPKLVDTETDPASAVGDEALLLARAAPTVVSRGRVAGAKYAKVQGASVIVMDDGLQNSMLAKDLTLAVVDGRRGIGNGRIFPAGPLRAPLAAQLQRTDALLIVGEDKAARDVVAQAGGRPVFHGRLIPDPAAVASLHARKVLAFAGIGDPEKFFLTLAQAGVEVAMRKVFPDHHPYSAEDAAKLIMLAEHDGLALVTTEKDRARTMGDPALAALAEKSHVLPVAMVVDEVEVLRDLVTAAISRRRKP